MSLSSCPRQPAGGALFPGCRHDGRAGASSLVRSAAAARRLAAGGGPAHPGRRHEGTVWRRLRSPAMRRINRNWFAAGAIGFFGLVVALVLPPVDPKMPAGSPLDKLPRGRPEPHVVAGASPSAPARAPALPAAPSAPPLAEEDARDAPAPQEAQERFEPDAARAVVPPAPPRPPEPAAPPEPSAPPAAGPGGYRGGYRWAAARDVIDPRECWTLAGHAAQNGCYDYVGDRRADGPAEEEEGW